MKSIRITFPDGKVYGVDFDYINGKYRSAEASKIGARAEEIAPIDNTVVNISAWIKRSITWDELSQHIIELPALSQHEVNRRNFPDAEIKVIEE